MNKYLTIYRTSFKQETKAWTNFVMRIFVFAVIIFVFVELWGYIYSSKGTGTIINGYSFSMMIWYLVFSEVMAFSVRPRGVSDAFSYDIKSGKIAYLLNKPYNYYIYQIFNQTAIFSFQMLAILPASIVIGLLFVGPIQGFSIAFVLPIALTLFLSSVLKCVIYGVIGLLAFWVEETAPFTWIVSKFPFIFGVFFPMEFFPAGIQAFIKYSPIFGMVTGPSKLVADFSWGLFLETIISQVSYIIVFVIVGLVVFNYGKKKVNLNGG